MHACIYLCACSDPSAEAAIPKITAVSVISGSIVGGIFLMVGLLLFVLVVVYWRRFRNKLRYLYM